MKLLFQILLVLIIGFASYGFYIKPDDPKTGHLFIGLGVVFLFFVLMPLFLYHRWKKKDVKDYMLTKENIEKMRDYKGKN